MMKLAIVFCAPLALGRPCFGFNQWFDTQAACRYAIAEQKIRTPKHHVVIAAECRWTPEVDWMPEPMHTKPTVDGGDNAKD